MAANQFAGSNLGQLPEQVTFSATTTSKTVEISYDSAVVRTTAELRDEIHKIMHQIEGRRFPAT